MVYNYGNNFLVKGVIFLANIAHLESSVFERIMQLVVTLAVTFAIPTILILGIRMLFLKSRHRHMEGHSRVTAIILSILMGQMGFDRFYLGYTGLGILKLITFGGFGIWWIVDIILICTGRLYPADDSDYWEDVQKYSYAYSQNTKEPDEGDAMDAIERLYSLYERGIISADEYNEKRSKYMDAI